MGAADYAISTTFKAKDKMTSGFNSMVKGAGKFENRLTRLTKESNKFGSCIQKALNLSNVFTGITAIATIGKNLKQLFDAPVKAAEIQIAAEAKLTGILKNNAAIRAKGANEYINKSKELFEMASSIQQKGIIGDEVLIGGMQQLASLGFDDSVIKKMTPAIADLIVQQKGYNGTIQDAETISKGLGRALAGNAGALSRMGVVLDKTQKKQLENMTTMQRANFLSKLLNDRVGGLNEEFGKSDRGAKIQYDNNKGDRIEEIGKRAIPIQARFYRLLNSQLPVMSKLINKFFNSVEYGLKKLDPVFNKSNELFSYLSKNLVPELVSYTPGIKMFFENVFVPGCIFAIDAVKILCEFIGWLYSGFKNVYNFIKDHFIPITGILAGVLGGVLYFNLQNIAWGLLGIGIRLATVTTAFWTNTVAATANKVAWWALGVALDKAKLKMLFIAGVWGLAIAGIAMGIIWLARNWDKVTAAVGTFWNKCKDVFAKVGSFIKDHFVDILLNALGPIGLIIRGVLKIGKAVGLIHPSLSGDDGIKFPNFRNVNSISDIPTVKAQPTSLSGSIGIHTTIDNNTGYPAKTETKVMENDNLNLSPA